MAILFPAGQKTVRSLQGEDILLLKDRAISAGYLRENCYVLNPDGIFSFASLETRYTIRHERASRGAQPDEIRII